MLSGSTLPELPAGAPPVWRPILAQLRQDAEAGAWSAVCYGLQEMLGELLAWFAATAIIGQKLEDANHFELPNMPLHWLGLLHSALSTIGPGSSSLAEACQTVFKGDIVIGDATAPLVQPHLVMLGLVESSDTSSPPWTDWNAQLFETPRYADVPTCQRLAVWGWKALRSWLQAADQFFRNWRFETVAGQPTLSQVGGEQYSLFPFYVAAGNEVCVLAGFSSNRPCWRNLVTGRPHIDARPLPDWLSVAESDSTALPEWQALHPDVSEDPRLVLPQGTLSQLGAVLDEVDSGYVFLQSEEGLGQHTLLSILRRERDGKTSGPPLLLIRVAVQEVSDPHLWLHHVDEALRTSALPANVRLPAPDTVAELFASIEDSPQRFARWLLSLLQINGGALLLGLVIEATHPDAPATGLADFLPDILPPHVVMLISTTLSHLPLADRGRLMDLRERGRIVTLDKSSSANTELLGSYLKEQATDLRDPAVRAEALSKADCKILWLRLFDRAFAANLFDSSRQLLGAWDFYSAIFRQMTDRLGKRVFELRALPLLMSLAICGDTVPREVVWLWEGYRSDTASLIARLGLLLRLDAQHRVGLSHRSLLETLLSHYEIHVDTTRAWLTRWAVSWFPARPVAAYTAGHVYGWAMQLGDLSLLATLVETPAATVALLARVDELQSQGLYATALRSLQDDYLALRQLRNSQDRLDVETPMAQVRLRRGQLYQRLGEDKTAINEYTATIGMMSRARLARDVAGRRAVISAMLGRAQSLLRLERDAEAQEDCLEAERLMAQEEEAATDFGERARNATLLSRILGASQPQEAIQQLRQAIDWYRKAGDPAVSMSDRAGCWIAMGDIQLNLDLSSEALQSYTEGLQELATAEPGRASRSMLAQALAGRCQARTSLGRASQNNEDLVRLVDLSELLVTQEHRLERRFDLALAHHALGSLLRTAGAVYRCLTHERRAVGLLNDLLHEDGTERMAVVRAEALAISAAAALRVGETSWALEDATAAVEGYQDVLEHNPEAQVYDGLVQTLALRREALIAIGDWSRAHQDADRAIAIAGRLGLHPPAEADGTQTGLDHPMSVSLAEAFVDRALVQRKQHFYTRSLVDCEHALDRLPGPTEGGLNAVEKRTLARAWRVRALTLAAIGDLHGALVDLDSTLQVERSGEDTEDLLVEWALGHTERGTIHLELGDLTRATRDFEQALTLWDRLVPHAMDNPDTRRVTGRAFALTQQGRVLFEQRRPIDAHAAIQQGINLYRKSVHQPRVDVADAYSLFGQVLRAEGHLDRALTAWDEAVGLYEALLLQTEDVDVMLALARTLSERAETVLHRHGRQRAFADADRSLQLCAGATAQLAGPPDRRRLLALQCTGHYRRGRLHWILGKSREALGEASRALELAAALRHGPALPGPESERAAIHRLRGEAWSRLERRDMAHEEFSRSIDIYERLAASDKDQVGALARVRVLRAAVRQEMGNPSAAMADCEQAERTLQWRGARGEDLAFVYSQWARIEASLGLTGQAESRMQAAIPLYQETLPQTSDAEVHVALGLAQGWLSDMAHSRQDSAAASEHWKQASRTLKGAPTTQPTVLADAWLSLADLAALRHRDELAEESATSAIHLLESVAPRRGPADLTGLLHNARLHRFHARLRRQAWSAALEDADRLVSGETDILPRARLMAQKGVLLSRLGRLSGARDAYKVSLETYHALVKEGDSKFAATVNERARIHNNLALVHLQQGNAEQSLREFSRAIEFRRSLGASPDVKHDLASTHYNRGRAYAVAGQLDNAIRDFDEAAEGFAALAAGGREVREMLALVANNLGQALADAGRDDEAAGKFDVALGLYAQLIIDIPETENHEGYAICTYNRAALRQRQGNLQDARMDFETAARILTRLIESHNRTDLADDLKACKTALQTLNARRN